LEENAVILTSWQQSARLATHKDRIGSPYQQDIQVGGLAVRMHLRTVGVSQGLMQTEAAGKDYRTLYKRWESGSPDNIGIIRGVHGTEVCLRF
jgi:hypothetical protein